MEWLVKVDLLQVIESSTYGEKVKSEETVEKPRNCFALFILCTGKETVN